MKTIQKQYQAVLVPTDKETRIVLIDGKLMFLWKLSDDNFNKMKTSNWKFFHLYILSDEEIKEGDWIYDSEDNIIYSVHFEGFNWTNKNHKKIISSNNPELKSIKRNHIGAAILGEYDFLPKPTDTFIQQWISKGCPDMINVEYEEIFIEGDDNSEGYFKKHLKISSDNTITCSFIEDDVVLKLLKGLGQDLLQRYEKGNGVFQHDIDKWLRENYETK